MTDSMIDVRTSGCCLYLTTDGCCGKEPEGVCDSWHKWAYDEMRLEDESFLFCQKNNPFEGKP